MRFETDVVYSILAQEFEHVSYESRGSALMVDYPLMYDASIDMRGHVVMVSGDDEIQDGAALDESLCICVASRPAAVLRDLGCTVLLVEGGYTLHGVFNRLQTRFAEIDRWDAQLSLMVDTYAGFQPLLDCCAQSLNCPCAIVDAQYATLYRASDPDGASGFDSELAEGAETLLADSVDMLMALPGYRRMRESRKPFPVPGTSHLLMRNVFHAGHCVGAVVLYREETIASARFARFAIERLAHYVEAMYGQSGSFGSVEAYPSLLQVAIGQALQGVPTDYSMLERLLIDDGHEVGAWYMLVQFERSFTNEGAGERGYISHRLERVFPGAYCIVADGKLFALADVGTKDAGLRDGMRRELSTLLRDALVKAGTSRPFRSMGSLYSARFQTEVALEQGELDDPMYWYYWFDDYVLNWILHHGVENAPAGCLMHPAIDCLRNYDARNNAQLLETLVTLVRCRYNASVAARKLFVARSTLLNRLERIDELTAIDFERFETRVYLELSVKLLETPASAAPPEATVTR